MQPPQINLLSAFPERLLISCSAGQKAIEGTTSPEQKRFEN